MHGERIRKKFYEKDIDSARETIINKHRKCRGRGFLEIKKKNNLGFVTRVAKQCPCMKKFDIVSRFILSNIPYNSLVNQQMYNKKVVDGVSNASVELIGEIIKPYIKNIRKVVESPYGFLFLGKNGTGKTFIGLKILYYAIAYGYTAHNIEFSDLLKLSRKASGGDVDSDNLLEEIRTVNVLLVDEIGSESKRSEFAISELKSLYKKRMNRSSPTIFISNYSLVEFNKVYGISVSNMVLSHCKVFDFAKSPDVRKAKCSVEMDSFFKKLKRGK